uniref:Uncharacterized protein n=1 Tax=Knipowitschia caucasica TaxID=637954 RepID=A0AAV2JTQ0_KNICA
MSLGGRESTGADGGEKSTQVPDAGTERESTRCRRWERVHRLQTWREYKVQRRRDTQVQPEDERRQEVERSHRVQDGGESYTGCRRGRGVHSADGGGEYTVQTGEV